MLLLLLLLFFLHMWSKGKNYERRNYAVSTTVVFGFTIKTSPSQIERSNCAPLHTHFFSKNFTPNWECWVFNPFIIYFKYSLYMYIEEYRYLKFARGCRSNCQSSENDNLILQRGTSIPTATYTIATCFSQ